MWLTDQYKRIKKKSDNYVYTLCRRMKCFYWRKSLTNKNFSMISNNCLGGIVCHDLGVRLNSPTVNLYMKPEEYLLFLENLEFYLYSEIVEVTSTDRLYPVGLLGGKIHLYFVHYQSFEEAVSVWKRRVGRINRDNLFVVLLEIDSCTTDHIERFDKLPYSRKVAITFSSCSKIQCGFYINSKDCSTVLDWWKRSNLFGGKYYDLFDWVAFLNEGKIQKSKI